MVISHFGREEEYSILEALIAVGITISLWSFATLVPGLILFSILFNAVLSFLIAIGIGPLVAYVIAYSIGYAGFAGILSMSFTTIDWAFRQVLRIVHLASGLIGRAYIIAMSLASSLRSA